MKKHGISGVIRGRLKKHSLNAVSLMLMVSLATMPARAYDWQVVVTHVITISPVGFPSYVEFTGDTVPSTCPGNYLFYFPQGADEATQQTNAKAVMAIVMAAQLSGNTVEVAGINPTSTFQYCQVQWIIGHNRP